MQIGTTKKRNKKINLFLFLIISNTLINFR